MRRSPGFPSVLRRFAARAAACLALLTSSAALTAGVDTDDARVAELAAAIAREEDPRVADALARIDGLGRQLLALRSYLRSRAHLAERWSWTDAQIEAFANSPEHAALQQEIERVREVFARENPGYELWVNPQVRSLDRQVESWNTNETVAAAAAGLLDAVLEHAATPEFRAADAAHARAGLARLLESHVPDPTPTVAAPGLSPHGQMRAIDFQVHRGGEIVAGPKTATIATDWDSAGWAVRLDRAVREGSQRFVGPLAAPHEPWHYTYTPDAVAAQ